MMKHDAGLRERHDDSIWRLKFKETWLYLNLLLEFQSGDEYFMTYMGFCFKISCALRS
ncbi:hypothetical protein [Methylotuvimicrobium alcaliphilum]|nr:hypothetical protein [Methylotuvimicrobium alcaliphilum]